MCAQLDSIPPRYRPLCDHLVKMQGEGHTAWHTSFAEVEAIVGSPLPRSAYVPSLFWDNLRQPRRASTAWFLAGWETLNVRIDAGTLAFRVCP